MSVIGNRHQVNKFVANKSAALSGQRLAKVGYKTTKDKETKRVIPPKYPSICVSIPHIDTANDPFLKFRQDGAFDTIIKNALENAQDGIVRSLYESSGGTLSTIGDDEIGIVQCLAFIDAENNGGRLTKEFIGAWFDENVSENLSVVIAEKLGFEDMNPEQMVVIGKHIAGYKGLFASLAGGKTVLEEKVVKQLQRALEVSSVEDDTAEKLNKRLANMLKPAEKMEDLLEL